jgi:hypothetical protein
LRGRRLKPGLAAPLIACLLLPLCESSFPGGSPWAEAYVWQRRWTGSLTDAVKGNTDLVQAWHVLAAEGDAQGGFSPTGADWRVLAATGRRIVPVIRIDGRLDDDAGSPRLVGQIAAVWSALPAAARQAIEIDYDSPTARLAGYADFLRGLRKILVPGTRLIITALPTWMSSADFPPLAAAVDGIVLQVHAVEDPRLGLFDAGRAARWVSRMAALTRTRFMVAVPAYGTRIVSSPRGGLLAAASESADLDWLPGEEEMAAPQDVAQFLAWLRAENFAALDGIVWFRLPTAEDRRAWSLPTLRAVTTGAALHPHLTLRAVPGWQPGLRDLVLDSDGDTDALLPETIALPAGCGATDGATAYGFDGVRLVRQRSGMLSVGRRLRVGWQRCGGDQMRAEP